MSHLKKIGLMMMFFGFHHAWLHAATFSLDRSSQTHSPAFVNGSIFSK